MNRDTVIMYVANFFGIDPDDDGNYDLSSYGWTAGCYAGRDSNGDAVWMSPSAIIDIFDELACDYDLYDDEWE